MSAWRIDAGVARDLAALVGWEPDAGSVALVEGLAATVPSGSTAKLEAVAAGRTPPGADPEATARRVLADRAAGRPEVSWSCWAMSTLMAALVETLGGGPAAVAAIRRVDAASPPVDVHSLVVVDGLLCDPYFSSVVPAAGPEVERVHHGVWARRTDEPDGRWRCAVRNGRWPIALEYRLLGVPVDRGDVAAFCAISTTHTGAPGRPYARVWRSAAGIEAFVHEAGGAAVRAWRWAPPGGGGAGTTAQDEHPDWAGAAAGFAARTGIPLA
ncbi:hypothetical protein HC251_23400 [Iamia sp. SCSIO 61187]|uniref:hypothetical protein n=1 Tax=Iamia sp. SCSIO 61187 TaxID=2722752 RepID=UPI001C62CF02|nr:hypothetical protein [Iamia sp. SCSIO 61187]QYG95085.1 hypothetical protein HC251_23400 [Iamia sp. SCSIO 61187]